MAVVFKPPIQPNLHGMKSVFLAGTIDNGQSEDWQAQVEQNLNDLDIVILNPRREQWDATWEQTIDNPLFREQVEWELDSLEQCDVIFMYFAPDSKSPITLLELGLVVSKKVVIVSPPGFWRRGNIEVVAHRYSLPLFESLVQGLEALRKELD